MTSCIYNVFYGVLFGLVFCSLVWWIDDYKMDKQNPKHLKEKNSDDWCENTTIIGEDK